MKKIGIISTLAAIGALLVSAPAQAATNISAIVSAMSTKDKIAQMLIPSFRTNCASNLNCNAVSTDFENVLEEYNFGGMILFAQNTVNTEQTTRLIDSFQRASAENPDWTSQLLIAVDQEGGYITRLNPGTNMPGNMALGATGDPELAYAAANVIGKELSAIGFNTDFAPVTDVNNNPANPIIGVRSFSDDPEMVGEFGSRFMDGLHDAGVMTSLKHFPGHGDTATDTHSSMTVVDKSYTELKNLELVPFQKLIDEGTDMIMTAHIQYPQIETTTYTSQQDGSEITLPATLSERIITNVLRGDMGYDGVVVTDALNMGAIADHFDRLDVAKLAINAGVDMLLMPFEISDVASISDLETYITDVANLVDDGTISSAKVDAAVTRILTMKNKYGLLDDYDVNANAKVANALSTVSTKDGHAQEFEIAKQAFTLIKNDDDVLPLKESDQTLIVSGYDSQLNSARYALKKIVQDGILTSTDNVSYLSLETALDQVRAAVPNVNNVVITNAQYGSYNFGYWSDEIDEVIELAHANGAKVIFLSTQLPYDAVRFQDADALAAVYYASGLTFDPDDYDTNIPRYGANVIAGIYQLFDQDAQVSGKLPVNLYELDSNYDYATEVAFARGHGLSYTKEAEEETEDADDETDKAEDAAGDANESDDATTTEDDADSDIVAPDTGANNTTNEDKAIKNSPIGVIYILTLVGAVIFTATRQNRRF